MCCSTRVKLYTFKLTVKAEMFALLSAVCVNVEVIHSQDTSIKLVMPQALGKNNISIELLSDLSVESS